MDLLETTVIIFLILYLILTIWACYDIFHNHILKTSHKFLLIFLILAVPLFSAIVYFLWRGNTELDDNIFYNSH